MDISKINNLPPKLKQNELFCIWKYEVDEKGRKTKIPHNPNNPQWKAKCNEQDTFAPIKIAVTAAEHEKCGLGVGIFGNLAGIDIDHCVNDKGQLSEMAQDIVQTMNAYTEFSPSGTGLRILFYAPQFNYDKAKYYIKNGKCGLEVYIAGMTKRFLTVTGNVIKKCDLENRTAELQKVLDKYMQRAQTPPPQTNQSHDILIDDNALINKALKSRNGDNFSRLWNGNWETYYPSQSEADQALCNMLAFWTNRDFDRMDRIFRQSGLMRKKWDRKQSGTTYGNITIGKAISNCIEGYEPKIHDNIATDFFAQNIPPVEPVATDSGTNSEKTFPQTRKPIICNSAATLNLDIDSQPEFFIPQILGQGVTFLNAPPKTGKSRLFMQMALALCDGDYFMGRKCKQTGVLYLALEDERCDFKPRLDAFLQGNNAPTNLYVATSEDFDYTPPTLENDELINLIESNLQAHSDIKVVLIDVFGAIRSKRQRGEDFMDVERRDIQSLIKLSAKNNIALAVSHHVSHTKKTKNLETIGSGAGSYVVAATVHAEMLLYKNEDTNSYTFSVQGRRMPLQKFAVIDDFPKWRFSGTAEEFEVANNPLIVTIQHIVDNSDNGQWCGLGADIVKYNQEHKLPPITATINKNTFSNKLIRQLSTISISYRQIKNGNGGVKHQFEKI